MAKKRVYELARELGLESKDVLERARELGLEVLRRVVQVERHLGAVLPESDEIAQAPGHVRVPA